MKDARQAGPFAVAVIICTRNRPAGLKRTLESIAAADRSAVDLRVMVVDNAERLEAGDVVARFADVLPVQLLHEISPGKGRALNRGLSACGRSGVIAVVDDDIVLDAQWFRDVRSITERWPDKGFFSGSVGIAWPDSAVPAWARDPYMAQWAYSVSRTSREHPVAPGKWVSGNCFWFRADLLPEGYRFEDAWLTEPPLMLDLAESGFGGILSPDAKATHHVEARLLDLNVIRRRAIAVGRSFADVRLRPYRKSIRQAVLFRKHPLASRVFCVLNTMRWVGAYALASVLPMSAEKRIVRKLRALERMNAYWQYVKTCRELPEYRIRHPFVRKVPDMIA